MVKVRTHDEKVDQRRAKEESLKFLEGSEPERMPEPAGKVMTHPKAKVDSADIFPHHLDLFEPTNPQAGFMGESDVLDIHGVKTHHLGSHSVYGNRVAARQMKSFSMGAMVLGPGPLPQRVPSITAKMPECISF